MSNVPWTASCLCLLQESCPQLLWHLSSKIKSTVWDFLNHRLERGENTEHQTRSVTLCRHLHGTAVRAKILVSFKLSVSVLQSRFQSCTKLFPIYGKDQSSLCFHFHNTPSPLLPPSPRDPVHILDFQYLNITYDPHCENLRLAQLHLLHKCSFLVASFYILSKMINDKRNSLMALIVLLKPIQK